jgi:hypothetical protein
MADRSLVTRAAWTVVIVLAGYLLVDTLRGQKPAPSPEAEPVATLAPQQMAPPPVAATPLVGTMPASAPVPAASATPGAAPAPVTSATASPSPTADPAEAVRAEQERSIRAQVAAAKAKAESLAATANTECPDLKPGELRHPGAVAHCARLRGEAAQAIAQYEDLRKQALAAGVTVP